MPNEPDLNLSRRSLIAAAAFVPLASLIASAQTLKPPARALPPAHRKLLDAIVDRLIPTDDLGPGALDAGAAEYIDRCLAGFLVQEKQPITDGLISLDNFARSSQGAGFTALSPDKRDTVLLAVEANTAASFPNSRDFFNRIRRLTLEGMFGDPHWGGNNSFAGWDLIRYPGPRLAVAPENQQLNIEITPYRKSAWGTASAKQEGESHGH